VNIIPKPAELSGPKAAALPLVTVTPGTCSLRAPNVQPGEDCCTRGGQRLSGSVAIQIAKLRGARVITTASTDEKLAKARELGR
jgi:NADPH:quinone reductase-like Zn-dependent oxidoreductase